MWCERPARNPGLPSTEHRNTATDSGIRHSSRWLEVESIKPDITAAFRPDNRTHYVGDTIGECLRVPHARFLTQHTRVDWPSCGLDQYLVRAGGDSQQ